MVRGVMVRYWCGNGVVLVRYKDGVGTEMDGEYESE